jgi:hypothetical protein
MYSFFFLNAHPLSKEEEVKSDKTKNKGARQ